MAFTTGQGFMPYLLRDLKNIMPEGTAPQLKVDYKGLLKYLTESGYKRVLNEGQTGAQLQQQQIKYKPRFTAAQTTTTDSCTVTVNQGYQEIPVNLTNARYFAVCLDDRTVQQYMDESISGIQNGGALMGAGGEIYNEILRSGNAICEAVNQDLWPLLTPAVGVNRRSGNKGDNINVTLNSNNFVLTDGFPQIFSDIKQNLFSSVNGKYTMIGSGLMENYMGSAGMLGMNQAGLANNLGLNKLNFLLDQDAPSLLGTNQVLLIDDGAVQLVEFMRFTGAYAGFKGTSTFGTIPLPVQMNNAEVKNVWFDYQLRYSDCPTTFTDSYYGTSISLNRGWNIILSKQFGLFTIPSYVYSNPGDPMFGNTGIIKYTITNS